MSSKIPVTGTPLLWLYMENNTVTNKFAQNLPNYGFGLYDIVYRPRSSDRGSLSSSNTKFGPQSLYFGLPDGWGISYNNGVLQCSDNNPVVLDKEFTISFWVYIDSATSNNLAQVHLIEFSDRDKNDSRSDLYQFGIWHSYHTDTTKLEFPNIDYYKDADFSIPKQQWVHIACTYDTQTYRLFINGNIACTHELQNNPLTINRISLLDSFCWSGYMEDTVLIKDQCLWTENFTPPTGPLFESYLVIPNTPTITGDPIVDIRSIDDKIINFGTIVPSYRGNSFGQLSLDSNCKFSDKSIVCPNILLKYHNIDLNIQNFTFSWWQNIISYRNDSNNGINNSLATSKDVWYFIQKEQDRGYVGIGIAQHTPWVTKRYEGSYTNPTINQWIHWAVTYDGSSYKMYKDGNLVTTNTYNAKIENAIEIAISGGNGNTVLFDDIVLIKDQVLWTGNSFEVPNYYLTGDKTIPKKLVAKRVHYPYDIYNDYFDKAYLY